MSTKVDERKGLTLDGCIPTSEASKLCCYLCSSFIRRHGFFNYRGCHWKIYHRWLVPTAFAAAETTRIFEETLCLVLKELKGHVRSLMGGEELPSKEPLRPETTLDMSSAATVSSRDSSEMTLKSAWSERMFKGFYGPTASQDAILLIPLLDKPGLVTISHEGRFMEMSFEDAKKYKDKFERRKLLPRLKNITVQRRCHYHGCSNITELRCKACRAPYCSRNCQKLDWHCHVFVCTVQGRPNLADSFILLLQSRTEAQDSSSHSETCTKQLLTDPDILVLFGFHRCETRVEVENLLSFYNDILLDKRIGALLQSWIDNGTLEENLKCMISTDAAERAACHEWFLSSNKLFLGGEPGMPARVQYGYVRACKLFIPELDNPSSNRSQDFNEPELQVLRLYTILLKDFDNVPDRDQSAWINFGFCYCRDEQWKIHMRSRYLLLALSATLEEIATFWNSQNRLDGLFSQKGIILTDFEREGIIFGRPTRMDLGVYRLMLEIDHIHRGSICAYGHTFKSSHKEFPESCLNVETVIDYGFDKLNPWERWHMMLLYQELFDAPTFDAREMLAARRSADYEAFQNYIEKMVDVKKYWNIYKADLLFPNLRGLWVGKGARSTCAIALATVAF